MTANIRSTTSRLNSLTVLKNGLLLIVSSLMFVACEQPQVVTANAPATSGGIEYTVQPYTLELLELDTPSGAAKYAKPVLVIPVKMKNVGQDPFIYNPEHTVQQMTETTTPLLYIEPKGEDVKLPPQQKSIINGAFLEKGTFPGTLEQRTTIAPGQEVTDYFLFEDPGKTPSDLIFSIPPAMNRGNLPLLFKIQFTPTTPQGPKLFSQGEKVTLGSAGLTIDKHEIAYIETNDSALGKGYTSQPLLKIDFTITNDGDSPITYSPDHRRVGTQGPGLFSESQTFERVRLQPTVQAMGQQSQPQTIAPGNFIKDYFLFVPPTQQGEVKLEVPGNIIGQSGVARVMLDVTPSNPDKPEELTTPKVIKAED